MVNAILGMGHDLPQLLARMQQQLRDLATQPVLLHASTGQDGGKGLSTDKNGLHLFNAAGVESATLATADGSATFGGNVIINGNLSVPNGSISNAALQNPVQTATSSNGVNNYAITTTSTVRASLTLTVPAGFTQAVVIANPTAMGFNSTASADYLYVQAVVQGINSGELYSAAGAGLGVGLASPFHTTLTGLTGGGTITVAVATRTSTATWAASTSNQANVYATALFLR